MDEAAITGHDRDAEHAELVRWITTWQRAGVELERQRRDRLATMTIADMRRAITAIFVDSPTPPPRPGSGLVEMQRLLSRLP